MSRIVVTDHGFPGLPGAEAAALRTGAELVVHQAAGNPAAIADAVEGADAVLVQYSVIDRAALQRMPKGAVVIRYGIGVDNIDTVAADELDIKVANVPDYGTDVVADHATAMLLALMRRLPWYDQRVRAEGWIDAADAGTVPAIASSTVGLLGAGRVATAVAMRLRPFGPRIIAFTPRADEKTLGEYGIEVVADLNDLFAESDALSLHAPALPSTHHIVNAERLRLMRSHAVLVNTARGALVDSEALLDALDGHVISAAALDVFEDEPLCGQSRIARHPRILHSPHAAFYSRESLTRLEQLAADEAERQILGEVLRCQIERSALG